MKFRKEKEKSNNNKEPQVNVREIKMSDEEIKSLDTLNNDSGEIIKKIGMLEIDYSNEKSKLKVELNEVNAKIVELQKNFAKKHKLKNIIEFRKSDNTVVAI